MSADQPVVISLHVEGFGGSADDEVEIPRAEWDSMTLAERTTVLEDLADEHAANHVAWGWHIYDPDDYASAVGDL
jgi:hypothetical protein